MSVALVVNVYEKTPENSKLRKFCTELLAYQGGLTEKPDEALSDDNLKPIWNSRNLDIYMDYFRCLQKKH
jgi:hypothetical protein